jgi:DNA-binding NtrC family response regulator
MSDVQLRRILIVEDDMPFSQMLQTLLERNGFAPDVARDGIEALEKLSAVSYQVVLLDYIIPKLTGLDVLRKLSHRQDMPPFVVLTGKGNESVAVEMMKLGAADYIVKDGGKTFIESLPKVLSDAIAQYEAERKKKDGRYKTFITMCAWTKAVKTNGDWIQVEKYLKDEFNITVSHGISPAARKKLRQDRRQNP